VRTIVVLDVGDVVLRTVPMAHYRALAGWSGLPWQTVAARIESVGLVARFETGTVSQQRFADAVRLALGTPSLTRSAVRAAWIAVLGAVDPRIAEPAARLASARRLVLASNTNAFHWPVVCRRLHDAGLAAPAVLSHRVGAAKPAADFFRALGRQIPLHRAVLVDDRSENVSAGAEHGLAGWLHEEVPATARMLNRVVAGEA